MVKHDQHTIIGYIGTYTKGNSKGIYRFTLDTAEGKLSTPVLAAELTDPTYITISQDKKNLYAILKEAGSGGVSAYSINEDSGELTYLGKQLTPNGSSCHISVDSKKQVLVTSSYGEGLIETYQLQNDATPMPISSTIRHEGHGPNEDRQEKAHTHFAGFTPDERFIAVVDLGIDKVITYKIHNGILEEVNNLSVTPGSGPRHLTFHPNGKFAYVMAELVPEVIALSFDSKTGSFSELQTVRTTPEDFKENNQGSAIHISEDGQFVYAANRGHDSIAVYKINQETGKLTFVELVSTEGHWPRDFSIDTSGKFLIASNEHSGNLTLYSRNENSGKLTLLQQDIQVPFPVCVKFL
ncbi:6-phosphogluconolactonase [Peribacillus sp. Bi96]|uniref:lactonase family protein n=1 Tax=Peribacillus sp. Bi96 TaxID=2884273 RepID=UPI001D709886|nr:lactonase family protein [Peribacillus sp. Bi96]CAH0150866.1 6-phosphogluconolactonase [Peribacillus sp. Bi96]